MAKAKAKVKAIKHILNVVPSKETEKDWLFRDALSAGETSATAAIPASKDLRKPWWKIGNQLATGSCVGWASADSVLRWHFVQKGTLTTVQLLSVRFQWLGAKETDQFNSRPTTFIETAGTSLKAALDISKKYGAVLENLLPFSGSLSGQSENSFYAQAATRRIASYFSLTSGNKLNNFRNWIANNGPILVRLDVDSTWDNVTSNGILATYDAAHTRGGHAVALVGYTNNHFIVRNSWGTGWADKGFAYASNQYTLDAFTEGYGVTV